MYLFVRVWGTHFQKTALICEVIKKKSIEQGSKIFSFDVAQETVNKLKTAEYMFYVDHSDLVTSIVYRR